MSPVEARWNAALELIRATDECRELAKVGRINNQDRQRYAAAVVMWELMRRRVR